MNNASGYWGFPMTACGRAISAFLCPLGHFEWLRMAQGPKNAPQIYQRVIDNCLWGFVRRLRDEGISSGVVGLSKEALARLEAADVSEKRSDLAIVLKMDVFHRGQVEALSTAPVIKRRSFLDDITFRAGDSKTLCIMLRVLLSSYCY
ncbi:TPA: hypothetical protein N0F65_007095 [Lagenidium giganteum]|uniref:Uncharacterized protein n=1 Tax=Lagenidium giganteum TaxID=4803 RepID=A0AAV2YL66_9STRA|nr:TPA: hypothetical protein N0F65_007095 [Lagenidium giganteum]